MGPNGAGKSTILEALYLASAWAKREDSIRGLNKEDYVILRRTGRGKWWLPVPKAISSTPSS